MAYDEELAGRIRELIASEPDLTEKRMFGGLAFLVGGHMAVAASGQGGLLVRVDPAKSEALLAASNEKRFSSKGEKPVPNAKSDHEMKFYLDDEGHVPIPASRVIPPQKQK